MAGVCVWARCKWRRGGTQRRRGVVGRRARVACASVVAEPRVQVRHRFRDRPARGRRTARGGENGCAVLRKSACATRNGGGRGELFFAASGVPVRAAGVCACDQPARVARRSRAGAKRKALVFRSGMKSHCTLSWRGQAWPGAKWCGGMPERGEPPGKKNRAGVDSEKNRD